VRLAYHLVVVPTSDRLGFSCPIWPHICWGSPLCLFGWS